MKLAFAPKYNGLAYALAVGCLTLMAMATVSWVPRWMPVAAAAREPAAGAADPEIALIEKAIEHMGQAAIAERTQRTVPNDGSDPLLPLYSPSAVNAAALGSKPLDAATLNVVIVETARGRTASIDGVPVRVGERTPGGGIVRSIDRTGVVIEDSAGTRQSVDIRERFVRTDSATAAPALAKPAAAASAPATARIPAIPGSVAPAGSPPFPPPRSATLPNEK